MLFLLLFTSSIEKKPSIEKIIRVKVYISSFMQARFIRIHTGLYLYPCYFILTSIVKNDSSFTAQAVVIMITK